MRGSSVPYPEPEELTFLVKERISVREVRIRVEKSEKRKESGLNFPETLLCFRQYLIRIHLNNSINHN